MDYNHITSFLEKFKKLIYQKEEIKEIVINTISEIIHHDLDKQSIKIKGGYVHIEGSPILHSEILIKKREILEKLKILLPNNNFLDIK